MFLIPRRQVLTGPPQGGVPELAQEWAGKVRKVVFNGVLPNGVVAGSTISRQVTKFGTSLVQASRIWNSNVGSQYAINLGTRPNSATFLIIAERNCDCNIQQNIPFIMNCATLGDGGVSIAMGNWWNSSNLRNKLHSGNGNPKWINGVAQTLNDGLSDADLISGTPYNIVVSMGTMTGGEYKLFAKDDSAGGYVSPVKIHLFVELDLQSPESAKSLSDNPWQIFKRPDSRIFVPVSAGGTTTSLIVQDATHAHIADSPSFSMATYLAVAESLHAHAADNVTLATTGTANLVVQEATHAHVADGVTLTTQWLLAVAEALHSHTAESVTLSLQTALVVLEALHTHAAENLTLGVTGTANLTIADATSGHTSEAVALTLNSLLAVFDAIHTHTADNLTLDTSNATALTVQDSTHAHGADNLGLSLDTWLAIVDAAHTHTADAPTLSASVALLIAEALHAHYADVAVLSLPGETTLTPEDITAIAAAVLAAINATTIPVNATHLNGAPIIGTGTLRDDWRGVGVPPQ